MNTFLREFLKWIKVLMTVSVFLLTLGSCKLIESFSIAGKVGKEINRSEVFSKYFTGLSVYDPMTGESVIDINADKYFTPASNIKILTLATYLELGLDSIPSFWVHPDQSITPLGDPTFLHPDFPSQPAFTNIKKIPGRNLVVRIPLKTSSYGPGWAWDDYHYNFQPERSSFPIYGNVLRVQLKNNTLNVSPSFFTPYIDTASTNPSRLHKFNLFNIPQSKLRDTTELEIPFITEEELLEVLLTDTLYKSIEFSAFSGGQITDTVYNQSAKSVMALMMQRSDNFIAEQLLINAQLITGRSSIESMLYYTNSTVFQDTPDRLIWVDGSGLSRYNMVTPRSMVAVLEKIRNKLTWNEIQYIFPTGGVSGTIRNWYQSESPYVFAKTGTLRHNHNLSGFLKTRSDRILIFSFMNNHYPFSNGEVKREMEKILTYIRDNY